MFLSVPKFAFLGWFGKIHIGGQVRAVFQKSLFGKMAKKVCVGYCFIGGNTISRACVCYVVIAFAPGCSWLLLVVPGRVAPYLKRFVLGWLRAGGGIYPLHT